MRIKYFILVVLVGVMFSSCKKKSTTPTEEIPSPTPTPLSDSIKQWAAFKVGTYWVYRDSVSGVLDSVYVTSVNQQLYYNSEELVINFNSNSFFPRFSLRSYPHEYVYAGFNTSYEWEMFAPSLNTITISNYSILSNTYTSLRYVYFSATFTPHSAPTQTYTEINYWKKNLGIVKRIVGPGYTSKKTYELLRYNIVQ